MELEDCAWPLLVNVLATDDPLTAFKDCDVAVLVGAMPRKEGMERKDLLKANAGIFKVQGEALDRSASKNVKVNKLRFYNMYSHCRFWWWVTRLILMRTLSPITLRPFQSPISLP